MMAWTRNEMAVRAAGELQDGYYVNLGIRIPTLVANHVTPKMAVTFQSETGITGVGPFPDEDAVDADIITDPAVFARANRRAPLRLVEHAPGAYAKQLWSNTEAQ